MKKETAQSRWQNLQLIRSRYLRRAIDCSSLTIPSLIPESDQWDAGMHDRDNFLKSLYQGTGARGVNTLAAKLLLALYPPQQPFFRLVLDQNKLKEYAEGQQDAEGIVTQVDKALARMERSMLLRLEELQARNAIFEAIKHLIVGGNGLLYVGNEGIRFYSLRSFCLARDPEGNVSEIVIKEQVSKQFLPSTAYTKNGKVQDEDDETVAVYTHVEIDPGAQREVTWRQECYGETIQGTSGFSTLDASPWIPLRWYRIAGEHYGRGLCEEVIGDLQSLEQLTRAIVEGSLISAKTLYLVNPNGVTRADVLAKAENGAIVPGNIQDVEALQTQKAQDYSVALQAIQIIERRLQLVFMSTEALQRDAERVTAAEIKEMAEQLESTLGGTYSLLSQELQLPIIKRIMKVMERNGDLPSLPDDLVQPQITTGIDAIGRGNDRVRLTTFIQTIAQAVGPEQFLQYLNPEELFARFAAADGIQTEGLIKTKEQLQQEQAQAQRLALQQQLAQGQLANGPNGSRAPSSPAQVNQEA